MGRIIIIRHGNRLDFIDPLWTHRLDLNLLTKDTTNSPLSECGLKQAQDLAQHLSSNFPNIKYIFSSPYLRTLQTAHPICSNLNIPIFVENSVAEGGGDVVGHDLPCKENESYFNIFTIDPSYQSVANPSSDESYLDTHLRVLPFIKSLEKISQEGDILIFTHAITKIALVRGLMKDPNLNVRVSTCSLTEIEFIEDRRVLHQLCYVDHLPNKGEHTWGICPTSYQQKELATKLPKLYEDFHDQYDGKSTKL
jgi:broad specificity phosphatase PhoE